MNKKVFVFIENDLIRTGLKQIIRESENYELYANESIETIEIIKELTQTKSSLSALIVTSLNDLKKLGKMGFNLFNCPTLAFSFFYSKEKVLKAIDCGVAAIYETSITKDKFIEVLDEISSNRLKKNIKMDLEVSKGLVYDSISDVFFTDKDIAILKLMCSEKSSSEIAEILSVSRRTIESRKSSMIKKNNCKNMTGVLVKYLKYSYYNEI